MKQILLTIAIVATLLTVLQNCTYDKEALARVSDCPDTANISFATQVQPLLRANCFSCHGNGARLGNVALDTYEEVKAKAIDGHLLGTISHSAGFEPMPMGADKLSDCDIKTIATWIEEGTRDN